MKSPTRSTPSSSQPGEIIKGFGAELWQQIIEYNGALPTPEDLSELTSPLPPVQYVDRRRRLDRGEISHDEVIDLALRMVIRHPKLTRLIADCYPVVFVDEYQNTSPKTIRLLLDHLAGAGRQSWSLDCSATPCRRSTPRGRAPFCTPS